MGRYILIKTKKGQVWSLDIVVALLIFVSELILSDNLPYGILSNNQINQTKLDNFYSTDYQTLRQSLGLKDNFYFVMDGLKIKGELTDYVGKINETIVSDNVKVNRIIVYKNKPVKFGVYIWR